MHARETTPSCPRCGYDQSGEIATWTDRCPAAGTCPECGTVYRWADLFDPSRQDLRWLVEHASSLGGRVRRTIPTLWRMAFPWVFWGRVHILARTNPGGVARWLVMLLALAHLVTWIPFSVLFAMMDSGYWLSVGGVRQFFRDSSPARLADAGLTGFCWPAVSFVGLRPSWMDYYGGRELLAMFRVPLGMGLAWALVMAVLPVTRRLAKLRRAHVLRALLLQWAAVVLGLYSIRLLIPLGEMYASITIGVVAAGVYLLVCIWSLAWWSCAIWIGWRVRSWPLVVLGTVAAVLGGAVAASIEASVSYMLGW